MWYNPPLMHAYMKFEFVNALYSPTQLLVKWLVCIKMVASV